MLPIGLFLVYVVAITAVIMGLMMQKLVDSVDVLLDILCRPPTTLPSKMRERRLAGFELLGAVTVMVLTIIIFADGIVASVGPDLERAREGYKNHFSQR